MPVLQPGHSRWEGCGAAQTLLLLRPTGIHKEACAPSDEPPVRTSQGMVVQWIRTCLPMQETRVRSLV